MAKYFFQIGGIILGNLFAFLVLGHILDVIFGESITYKVIFIILSIPCLVLLMWMYSKKFLKQLKDITVNGSSE